MNLQTDYLDDRLHVQLECDDIKLGLCMTAARKVSWHQAETKLLNSSMSLHEALPQHLYHRSCGNKQCVSCIQCERAVKAIESMHHKFRGRL